MILLQNHSVPRVRLNYQLLLNFHIFKSRLYWNFLHKNTLPGTGKESFWQEVMVMADDIPLTMRRGSHLVWSLKNPVLSSYKYHWGSSIMPDTETSWEILFSKDFLVHYFYFLSILQTNKGKNNIMTKKRRNKEIIGINSGAGQALSSLIEAPFINMSR